MLNQFNYTVDVNHASEQVEDTNISNYSKEYIPVFALNRFNVKTEVIRYLSNTVYAEYFSKLNNQTSTNSNITLFLANIFHQLLDNENVDLEELEILNSDIQNIVLNYCKNGESKYKDKYSLVIDKFNLVRRIDTYESLIYNNLNHLGWGSSLMRTKRFISNYMYLMDLNSKKVIYCLAVKSKYIEYYRMCVLLNRTPNPKIFTMFVDQSISFKNPEFKYLRTKYLNEIENPLIQLGVEKVVTENILEIITSINKLPSDLKTIKDRVEWIRNVKNDFLIFEGNRLKLLEKNIKLEVA